MNSKPAPLLPTGPPKSAATAPHVPRLYFPLAALVGGFCVIDLALVNFGGYMRHSLYILGSVFVVQVLLVILAIALLLVLVASTRAFRAGHIPLIANTVRRPLQAAAAYAALLLAARGYQLSEYAKCWYQVCPSPSAASATIWTSPFIAAQVLIKLGSLVYYTAVGCTLARILAIPNVPNA
ncbi:hypothetical protein H9P43_005218 [Blastocladiella emersonii ATCC 22665]|nr:hypothetical protein H9P43_005218 [Blastocladiella emersonii ATCC 22665]